MKKCPLSKILNYRTFATDSETSTNQGLTTIDDGEQNETHWTFF